MLKDPPFPYSSLAPSRDELNFIYDMIYGLKILKVLEFGCGVTTWAIYSALADSGWTSQKEFSYVAVEHFQPCIKSINEKLPDVKIIETVWQDIPKHKYDLVFVDSSAGYKMPGVDSGIHRKEALIFSESLMNNGAIVMMHDYNRNYHDYKALKNYLLNEDKYKAVASLTKGSGVGVFRKRLNT